jgi:hypothetical protein
VTKAAKTIQVRNVNLRSTTNRSGNSETRVNAERYEAMKKALLKAVPRIGQGRPQAPARRRIARAATVGEWFAAVFTGPLPDDCRGPRPFDLMRQIRSERNAVRNVGKMWDNRSQLAKYFVEPRISAGETNMRHQNFVSVSRVAVALLACLSPFAVADDEAKTPPASPRLEAIKALAGEWVRIGDDGKPTDEIVSAYRVTAGGSAVIETLFPGQPHEMVTVYHDDGDALVLTHYCMLGSQPRMRARETDRANTFAFSCAGGSNMASHDDAHMHDAELTIIDANQLKAKWTEFVRNQPTHSAEFNLARKR